MGRPFGSLITVAVVASESVGTCIQASAFSAQLERGKEGMLGGGDKGLSLCWLLSRVSMKFG